MNPGVVYLFLGLEQNTWRNSQSSPVWTSLSLRV